MASSILSTAEHQATIPCLECKVPFHLIHHRHLQRHGLTVSEYLARHPGATLSSPRFRERVKQGKIAEGRPPQPWSNKVTPHLITPEERLILQASPTDTLFEQKKGWTDVIICRICLWQGEKLSTHLRLAHRDISEPDYKFHFGYSQTTKLISADLRQELSVEFKKRNSRRRHKGLSVLGQKVRYTKRRYPKRIYGPRSAESRQRNAQTHQNMPHVPKRKRNEHGQSVSDWQIAKLRLEGKTIYEIGKRVNPQLTGAVVLDRLDRIGFPKGKRCQFFRGEVVSRKLFCAHYEDVVYVRTNRRSVNNYHLGIRDDLSKRLGINPSFVSSLVTGRAAKDRRRRALSDPLSERLSDAFLASIQNLRVEFKKFGSTSKGGRPKVLLPSEERELPQKYQDLKADLEALLSWAEEQAGTVTLDTVGAWMCEQSRQRKLRCLLFWPRLHSKLAGACVSVHNRLRGGLGAAERAKELLCEEYAISPAALDRAIALRPAA